MKRKETPKENKSLKTFFLYTALVLLCIVIALIIKAVFVIRESKFKGAEQFVTAIAKRGTVKEIISIDPAGNSSSILRVNTVDVTLNNLGKQLGVAVDSTIDASMDPPAHADAAGNFLYFLLSYSAIRTQLTLYDFGRLSLAAKGVPSDNREEDVISSLMDTRKNDQIVSRLFSDSTIVQENLSVQIVNGSGIAGFGTRLARVLSNKGANVISIITAHDIQHASKIQYYGKQSYTLGRLQSLFGFKTEKVNTQQIANIVITVGEESRNTSLF